MCIPVRFMINESAGPSSTFISELFNKGQLEIAEAFEVPCQTFRCQDDRLL